MKLLENKIIAKVKPKVKHQGIGGKEIIIEREGTMSYIIDMNCDEYTIAVRNFIMRRDDIFTVDEDMKLYYGHVGNLGYFVAEDELILVN